MAWSSIEKVSIAGPDGGEVQVDVLDNQRAVSPAAGGGGTGRTAVESGAMAAAYKGTTRLFDVVAWVPVGRRYEARRLVKEDATRRIQAGQWESGKSYDLAIR